MLEISIVWYLVIFHHSLFKIKINEESMGTKTSYHRHNGVSVGWVNSYLVGILFFLAEYFATFLLHSLRSLRFRAPGATVLRKSPSGLRPGRFSPHLRALRPPAPLTSLISQKVAKYQPKRTKYHQKRIYHPTETPLSL